MAGRVQVYGRCRPMVEREAGERSAVVMDAMNDKCIITSQDDSAMDRVLQGKMSAADVKNVTKNYDLDGVFDESHGQKDVFDSVGAPVLRDVLKGYNGCIFAYGQTGSGKTHSLLNAGNGDSAQAGIVPRIVANLFVGIASDVASVYTVDCAMFQVYNEQVDDLLADNYNKGGGANLGVANGGDVTGLTWKKCVSPDELLKLFARGRNNIVYAETKMNKASSRSHAVMQLKVMKRPRSAGTAVPAGGAQAQRMKATYGKLSVVDLAGSERVKKSGVAGKELKEAANINGSLLALGNVIQALASKRKHIPYRDSKLTRILQDSVGGNSKTSLLICLSPAAESVTETLGTLDFGTRAMSVEITATVNECQVVVDAEQLANDLAADGINAAMMAKQRELLDMQKGFADKDKARQKELDSIKKKANAEEDTRKKAAAEKESLIKSWQTKAKAASSEMAKKEAEMTKKLAEAEKRVEEAGKNATAQKSLEAREKELATLRGVVKTMESAVANAKTKAAKELEAAISKTKKESLAAQAGASTAAAAVSTRLSDIEAELQAEKAARAALETELEICKSDLAASRADAMDAAARHADLTHQLQSQQAAHEAMQAAASTALAEELAGRVSEVTETAARTLSEATKAHETEIASLTATQAASEQRFATREQELWAKVEAAASAGKAAADHVSDQAALAAVEAEARQRTAVASVEADMLEAVAERESTIASLEATLDTKAAEHAAIVSAVRAEADEREQANHRELEKERERHASAARSQSKLATEELAMHKAIAKSDLSDSETKAMAQIKRMSAAFASARVILADDKAEALAARASLQRRFDSRESRQDDLRAIAERDAQIKRERAATRRALQEVQQMRLHVQHIESVDNVFACGTQNRQGARVAGSMRSTLAMRKAGSADNGVYGPEGEFRGAHNAHAPRTRPSSAFTSKGRPHAARPMSAGGNGGGSAYLPHL